MKVIFEKIRYKNLLSTGDHFTEIVFNRDKLSLIMGENGHGKCLRDSTTVDITFEEEEVQKKFEDFLKNR